MVNIRQIHKKKRRSDIVRQQLRTMWICWAFPSWIALALLFDWSPLNFFSDDTFSYLHHIFFYKLQFFILFTIIFKLIIFCRVVKLAVFFFQETETMRPIIRQYYWINIKTITLCSFNCLALLACLRLRVALVAMDEIVLRAISPVFIATLAIPLASQPSMVICVLVFKCQRHNILIEPKATIIEYTLTHLWPLTPTTQVSRHTAMSNEMNIITKIKAYQL